MKVTQKQVNEAIEKAEYHKAGEKTTVCVLTLKDGFEVVGFAGVVDPTNFDMELGSRYAKEKALDKVWQHLGSIAQYKKSILQKLTHMKADEYLDEAVEYFLTEAKHFSEVETWEKPQLLADEYAWMDIEELKSAIIKKSINLKFETLTTAQRIFNLKQ